MSDAGESIAGATSSTTSSPRASAGESSRRSSSRSRRRRAWWFWIVIALVVLGGATASIYVLETVPLTSKSYSITVTTQPIASSSAERSPLITSNDSGIGSLTVPQGSTVSGRWFVSNDTEVILFILYGSKSYDSNSTSSGSFSLKGGSPFGSSGPNVVWFDVISPYPVSVTFQGKFTAPLL